MAGVVAQIWRNQRIIRSRSAYFCISKSPKVTTACRRAPVSHIADVARCLHLEHFQNATSFQARQLVTIKGPLLQRGLHYGGGKCEREMD